MKIPRLLCAVTSLALVAGAQAMPAHPSPARVAQPDGDSLTVQLVGDEFYHYTTTSDGYTLLRGRDGAYSYATLLNGRLESTGVAAHDAARRTAAEQSLLAATRRHLTDRGTIEQGRSRRARRDNSLVAARRAPSDWEGFRGLVILVQFTDKKFQRSDANSFYSDMLNTRGYSGYTSTNRWGGTSFVSCTGSMRDYFYENSMGQFDPEFDVVGPVTVNYPCKSFGDDDHTGEVFTEALDAVDGEVDFSQYDCDGDGTVDMVYFLVAGYAANYSGNSDDYLWPHMSYMMGYDEESGSYVYLNYDGKNMGRYACSTEIYGWESYGMTDLIGIGTMCHEFSHVMGILDLYDTDYGGSGGQSNHPGEWDLMAGGGHFNYGRTPVGYSLYDRYAMGFAHPTVIDGPGDYTLDYIGTTNEGYMIRTPQDREFFLLENRQQTRWDEYLPGHGMIVARVDSTESRPWWSNTINANPAHQYYELLRAGNSSSSSPSDPFPGTSQVTELSNYTTPGLMTWAGLPCELMIQNIAEDGDGLVSFTVKADDEMQTVVEDFETMPVSTSPTATDVMGRFWKWNFIKATVSAPGEGKCNGAHAVAMSKPSALTTAHPVTADLKTVAFTVFNPTSVTASFSLSVSKDDGQTFTELQDFKVAARSTAEFSKVLTLAGPCLIRFSQTSGSANSKCYLDDISFKYLGEIGTPPAETLAGDVNGDGEVGVADLTALVALVMEQADNERSDVNGDGETGVADISTLINIILGQEATD